MLVGVDFEPGTQGAGQFVTSSLGVPIPSVAPCPGDGWKIFVPHSISAPLAVKLAGIGGLDTITPMICHRALPSLRLLLAAALAGWTLAGCRPPAAESAAGNPADGAGSGSSGGLTNYQVSGIVRELKPDGTNVVIKHDRIAGFMESMTMNFDATNPAALHGLKVNDAVQFQLHVTADDSWVNGFQVLSNVGPAAVTVPEVVLNDPTAVSFFRVVPELKEGDEVPNYTFTNQLEKTFNLTDYRGRVLAFSFIFTRCPMPDFCPRISARMRSAQNSLLERKDAPPDWQLLSLSIDPLYDTPPVLSAYAHRYGANPARWIFGTGAYEQLQPLGSHFGLEFAMNVTPDRLGHKLRTVVIDRAGRVRKILVGNEWAADTLVEAIIEAGAK